MPDAGCDARNSMSLRRAPGPIEEATRGSVMNFPFWPGGFEEPEKNIESLEIDNFDFENDLLSIAPGFTSGLQFECGKGKAATAEEIEKSKQDTVNLLDVLQQGNSEIDDWLKSTKPQDEEQKEDATPLITEIEKISDDMIIAPDVQPILNISNTENIKIRSLEWAEMIDITHPVTDFYQKIPNPAMTYPFELDVFQKQAILLLEERKHVFVAAHTSAGKTVVAEYAIALSQNHMTKTIYTSPIKALSNQKYRDFKEKFKDVGLITGDLQIEPTASCLIMTTEILRSMLYCGSDSTRDLEYVIFDEVHYINNADRGHVWEEVLILLPEHVNIIMLSATVPNTLEFANWVGHTKKRKVYVISTLKRPVPLMHHLYTGCGGKSKNDIFVIVNEKGEFLTENYRMAVAKKEANAKGGNKGPPNPKQDQTLWVGLVDYLKRNDKLPVVAFTLSRNRCDRNAIALQSCDLNTGKEKSLVRSFFQQCLQKLKPPDRILPQVTSMQSSLERGIGIHHSGILPILKEIVEMLFQRGLVKLLFATETFAMGVNMPARTVIFDSHIKFDGNEQRMLEPAEYIQMAGRAGRRGHDANGTVILLCKNKIPSDIELRSLILGRPMRLESRFLLTYAMILTCLRFENVTVEDIMSHSFKEFPTKQKLPETEKQLKLTQEKISTLKELDARLQPLCTFYDVAVEYRKEMDQIMKLLISQPKIAKELKIGRVLIISQSHHYNKLAILLSVVAQYGKEIAFKVLVLDHENETSAEEKAFTLDQKESQSSVNFLDRGELWHKMISLTPQYKHFHPEGIGGHAVLKIGPTDIVEITKKDIKVDADLILKNWDMRQIPRFKDSPPGPSVVKAVTDLHNLNNSYIADPNSLQFVNMTQEINILGSDGTNIDVLETISSLKRLLKDVVPYTNIANFEHEFAVVFDRKNLENKLADLQFTISKKSLQLYPDYCNKLQVLRALNYIDDQNEVTIKGNVACGMGQNELIITELVLCNIFTDLDTAEIAALLSSLVFQAKTNVTPALTDRLKEGMEKIIEVDDEITKQEKIYKVTSTEAKTRLNFGLVEVVYEWARNKPFAEIMELTDVQEGIIVRCIQQLDETLRDVKTAATRIGNPALQSKMEEASNTIKRDIVFTASLYTTL